MAGIRVINIPKNAHEKHLKVHFSKPSHGGGSIKKIYYPLTNNDAVILFEDRTVVDRVLHKDHFLADHQLEVHALPEHMVFSTVEAKLDSEASIIVQVTESLWDEMKYNMEIKITEEPDQTYRLKGNWFQLEWAWHYIDCFMQQQEVIQHQISQQPQRYAGQPMEVDQSEMSPRNSPSEVNTVNTELRKNISERSRAEREIRPQSRTEDEDLYADDMIASLSYHDDRDIHPERDSRSPFDIDIEKSKVRSDPPYSMQVLKDNISDVYSDTRAGTKDYSSMNYQDEDDLGLQGVGYKLPLDSMKSITDPTHKHKRYQDENATFKDFSGQTSIKPDPHQSLNKSLKNESSRQASVQHEKNSSLQSQSPGASPSKSSYNSPCSDTEGSGRSAKPSLDAVDQSMSRGKSKFGARLTNIPRHYTEDQLLHTFDIRGLKITVYYGDLVAEETAAIVNAANEHLSHYGGIAYIIRNARGPEMDEECAEYIRNNGNLRTTEVTHTSGGGKLNCLHVIHAAGPMWLSEQYREKFTFELTQTFLNCLEYAERKLQITSLALPAISTGVYGAPLDTCVRCFLDAILIFTQQHGSSRRLADVRLVNNDAESTVTSIVLMQTLIDNGVDGLTENAVDCFRRFSSKDREMNLPKGRPEYSDFSKTYATKTSPDYGASSYGLPDDFSEPSVSRRRSSSLSRMPEKKSTSQDKRYDESGLQKYTSYRGDFVQDTTTASLRSSGSDIDKHRERSGSFGRKSKKDQTSEFSKTVSGTWSYQKEDLSYGNSPKRSATSDTKSMPKMKASLHKVDNDKLRSMKTARIKDRLGLVSSAEYGSFTHRGTKHSAISRTPTDTSEDEEHDFGMRSLPAYYLASSSKGAYPSRDKLLRR